MREFAGPGTYLGPAPTVVVLLKQDQAARNAAFCSGFQQIDTDRENAAASVVAANVVRTRWLVKTDDLQAAPTDCAAMVQAYDFTRSGILIAEASKDAALAASLAGNGPFLLEILPDGSMVAISGSGLPPNQLRGFGQNWVGSATEAFSDWSQNPEVRDCIGEIELGFEDLGGQLSAFFRCKFPNGVTVAHARVAACFGAKLAGWPTLGLCPSD